MASVTGSGQGSGAGAGAGASAGASTGGTSGSPSAPDAAAPPDATASPMDAAREANGGMGLLAAKDVVCTQVMGVSITYDWFTHGFDMTPLDITRWQLKGIDIAGMSFIDEWSNSASALWGAPVVSPCANGSSNPDRIIFVGVNWTYTTAAQWVSAYGTLLTTLKTKYSNLKRVDLMTMLRAPGNMLCPGNNSAETIVAPLIDQAIATFVTANPTFVTAAPKFYVPDCSVFQTNSPHLVAASIPAVAAVLRTYYASEP